MMSSSTSKAEKRKPPSSNDDEEKAKDEEKISVARPPPPKKLAISLKKSTPASTSTLLSLGKTETKPIPTKNTTNVKAIFESDSDSDETEEMPAECRMRMRNVGRNTPTSAGPNSFRKGKQGFVDGRKQAELRVQEMIKAAENKTK